MFIIILVQYVPVYNQFVCCNKLSGHIVDSKVMTVIYLALLTLLNKLYPIKSRDCFNCTHGLEHGIKLIKPLAERKYFIWLSVIWSTQHHINLLSLVASVECELDVVLALWHVYDTGAPAPARPPPSTTKTKHYLYLLDPRPHHTSRPLDKQVCVESGEWCQ